MKNPSPNLCHLCYLWLHLFATLVVAIGLLCVLSICVACCFAETHALLDVPLDDPAFEDVYCFVERMAVKHELPELLKNRRPYSQEEIERFLTALMPHASEFTEAERHRLFQIQAVLRSPSNSLLSSDSSGYRLGFDFEPGLFITHRSQPVQPSGTEYACQLRPTAYGTVADNLAFSADLRFYLIGGTDLADTVRAEFQHEHRGAGFHSGALMPSYTKLRLPWFELFFGKDTLSWGPGRHGNLLLSAHAMPMEMIRLQAQYGGAGYQWLAGVAEGQAKPKVVTAHRLDFNIGAYGRLGIAEALVTTPEDFDIRFANPFITVYNVIEPAYMGGKLSNLLTSLDLEWRLGPGASVYGEILIDDFQAQYGLNSWRHRGSKLGILLGAYLVDPLSIKDLDLRFEYTFINQYAYTHRQPVTAYTHLGRLIGHQIGTDADDWWFSLTYWPCPAWRIAASYELERHGQGGVYEIDDVYQRENELTPDAQWEFLSGIAESTHHLSLQVQFRASGTSLLSAGYRFSRILNLGHHSGARGTQHELSTANTYRF